MKYALDVEFSDDQLLSLALVSEQGHILYLAIDTKPKLNEWVEANVWPIILEGHPILAPVEEWAEIIEAFIEDDSTIYVDWPIDIKHFCDIMITGPGTMINIHNITFVMKRINARSVLPHNALADARGLARVFFDG